MPLFWRVWSNGELGTCRCRGKLSTWHILAECKSDECRKVQSDIRSGDPNRWDRYSALIFVSKNIWTVTNSIAINCKSLLYGSLVLRFKKYDVSLDNELKEYVDTVIDRMLSEDVSVKQ